MSREYQFHCPCYLSKVLCRLLYGRPLGWFLIVPSSLSVAQKHFHKLALLPCLSRIFFGIGGAAGVYRLTTKYYYD